MVESHFADTLRTERLPRKIAVTVPATRRAGHALAGRACSRLPFGPLGPGVTVEGVLAERRQFLDQLPAFIRGEAGGDPDVVQSAGFVEQAQQEGADQRSRSVLVPSESGHDAVGRTGVLDLGPAPLGGHVQVCNPFGDDPVQAGAFETVEPVGGYGWVGRGRGQVHRRPRAGEGPLQEAPPLPLRDGAQVAVAEGE